MKPRVSHLQPRHAHRFGSMAIFLVAVGACAPGGGPERAPTSLSEAQIPDDFRFETQRAVRLDLASTSLAERMGAPDEAVLTVRDVEGRVFFRGTGRAIAAGLQLPLAVNTTELIVELRGPGETVSSMARFRVDGERTSEVR